MQTEIEVKILEINVDEITSKLEALWAKKSWDKMQKRYVYDFSPKKGNSRVRLRTDGNKTTLTIKEIHNDEIEWTKELEVIVDDFEKTNLILEKLGYKNTWYQENKRTSYILDTCEVEIDSRPGIPAYIEIEAKSVAEVEATVKKLWFTMDQTTSINTIKVYQKYGIDISIMPELKF